MAPKKASETVDTLATTKGKLPATSQPPAPDTAPGTPLTPGTQYSKLASEAAAGGLSNPENLIKLGKKAKQAAKIAAGKSTEEEMANQGLGEDLDAEDVEEQSEDEDFDEDETEVEEDPPIAPAAATTAQLPMGSIPPVPVPPPSAPGQPPAVYATVEAQLKATDIPVPNVNDTPAAKKARDARFADGTVTEADVAIENALAQRDAIIAANNARRLPYKTWNLQAGGSKQNVNEFTSYDAEGKLILPPATIKPGPSETWASHYVNATQANILNMSPAIADLFHTLAQVNGEDAYSNETVALGRLTEAEYLALPANYPIPEVPIEEVGTPKAQARFHPSFLWGVYVLNRKICKDPLHAVRFGLARMEAVKLGWFLNQREVKIVPFPSDIDEVLTADRVGIQDNIKLAQEVAWLIPFACEHTFRTKGHHFISGLTKEYLDGYTALFKACLKSDIPNFLPADMLYHTAFHWITPERVWKVLDANQNTDRIPAAIKLRKTAAPAGSAMITTTAAVIRSLQSSGIFEDLVERNVCDFEGILALDEKIRKNPVKYHRMYAAYGLPALPLADETIFNTMKAEAEKLGPLSKAFCDTMLKAAPLGKQRVLEKCQHSNPTMYNKAKKYFQAYIRKTPSTLDEVFPQSKKSKPS